MRLTKSSLTIFLFCFYIDFAQASYHVIIDPGHGGIDRGATKDHIKESTITLNVSKELEKLLLADPRFKVSLTRRSDIKLPLSRRSKFAIQNRGDLFVSVHINSSPDSSAKGAEFYFQNQLPPDEESMFLANKENSEESLLKGPIWPLEPIPLPDNTKDDVVNILKDLQRNERIRQSGILAESLVEAKPTNSLRRRPIRQAPFYVINHVDMPSVLVELGFVSHSSEAQKLTQASYQKRLARELYDGIIKFKEKLDKY